LVQSKRRTRLWQKNKIRAVFRKIIKKAVDKTRIRRRATAIRRDPASKARRKASPVRDWDRAAAVLKAALGAAARVAAAAQAAGLKAT
jgi:hypothetical protein